MPDLKPFLRRALPALSPALCLALCLVLLLAAVPAQAQGGGPDTGPGGLPTPAALPGVLPVDRVLAPVIPGEAGWVLGELPASPGGAGAGGGSRCVVAVDQDVRTPEGAPSFRVDYDLGADPRSPGLPGCFAGVLSRARRNLHKARGIAFAVRAEPPVSGLLDLVTSNPDDPRALDRFFGSFAVGGQWKQLRIPFRHLAPSRSWTAREAAAFGEGRSDGRPGARTGDGVLRPDSIEEIRIGLDMEKAPQGRGRFWVGDLVFFR